MHIRILGSAAGGGLPQWNCNCPVCQAARQGRAVPRSQSSIAVRSGSEPWVLVNASPDIRQQLAELPVDRTGALRSSPIGAVILTDGEIDHAAGLLLLRESSTPLRIYSTEPVRAALSEQYPVLEMLEHYCGVDWRPLTEGRATPLEGFSLTVEPFPTGGDPPLYMGGEPGPGAIGLTIREPGSGAVLSYAPALETLDETITTRLRASDCILADGTFWRADDLVALGLGERDAFAMGHAPLCGPDGTLEVLGRLGPRTILVHINNTNPLLLEGSEEREMALDGGVEIGYDGMEVDL
jgi:pyrroloquinoline quinone biosynthesis protein B